jgi:hypothetical protein
MVVNFQFLINSYTSIITLREFATYLDPTKFEILMFTVARRGYSI